MQLCAEQSGSRLLLSTLRRLGKPRFLRPAISLQLDAPTVPKSHTRHNSSFITTPIFYVNSSPHIGHLYSALIGDVVHRWRKLKGSGEVAIFSTGTDEHGMKIYKAADAAEKEPKVFCDEVSNRFKELFDRGNISYTHYIRTTDEKHAAAVSSLWNTLLDNGYIYKGEYKGWYCVADEEYLTDSEVTYDKTAKCKVSVHSGRPVEWYTEENYMFRLTHFRDQLLQWLNTAPYPVVPMFAKERVFEWLTSDQFADLSVSRPSTRLPWGIPVPGDSTQTMYVWLDALANYLSVSGYPSSDHTWPPTEHIIGQDILRFHAIYWPAFLMAAGLDLPKKIVTHTHWTCNGYKMSKSRGNIVEPLEQFDMFGVDEVRYFMLKRGCLQRDAEYSMDSLVTEVNTDLANSLGNLILRISSRNLIADKSQPGMQYSSDVFPFHVDMPTSVVSAEDLHMIQSLHELPGAVDNYYQNFQIREAVESISICLNQNNKFLSRWEPWVLVKDPSNRALFESVLLIAMENLRLCCSLLLPIIPRHASTALNRLGFSRSPRPDQLTCLLTEDGVKELEASSALMREHRHNQKSRALFTKLVLLQPVKDIVNTPVKNYAAYRAQLRHES